MTSLSDILIGSALIGSLTFSGYCAFKWFSATETEKVEKRNDKFGEVVQILRTAITKSSFRNARVHTKFDLVDDDREVLTSDDEDEGEIWDESAKAESNDKEQHDEIKDNKLDENGKTDAATESMETDQKDGSLLSMY